MTNQDHIWHILDDVLLLLAGQHYPTPERTYKLDGGWSLALADLKRCFADLRSKLAAVEAERDAATKKAEQLLLSRYFTRCREGAFDHSTDCATWGNDGQGNVDGKPVHPPCNCGASWNWAKQMEAERDAARAGEARAVEALEKIFIGGNHLASALIHLLGDDFPEYETDFNEALEMLNDPIKYDLWVCWAIMMRERDAMNDPKLAAAIRAGKGVGE